MIGTADPDQDGLTNTQELAYGTDTNQWDSDGDGYSDGEEISFGSDPLDSESLASYPGLFRLFGYKLPADNDVTEDIALGDVDGDGDQDIVCANAASRNRLYLNRGGGEFVDATVTNLPPVYDFSRGLALGDLDNDGDLDMAVANGGYQDEAVNNWYPDCQQDRVYLNSGSGCFSNATFIEQTAWGNDVSLADLNRDGWLDMILADGNYSRVTYYAQVYRSSQWFTETRICLVPRGNPNQIWFNLQTNAAGEWQGLTQTSFLEQSQWSNAVAVGDVNGDDWPDLVFANSKFDVLAWEDSTIQNEYYLVSAGTNNTICLNQGTNGSSWCDFSEAPLFASDSDISHGIALFDIDLDGDLDAVVANERATQILYSWVDFTGPGNEHSKLYINDGFGNFTAGPDDFAANGVSTKHIAIGDVNGDGFPDAAFSEVSCYGKGWIIEGGENRLYLNQGTDGSGWHGFTEASFIADSDYTDCIALGDLDGDSDADMVVGNGFTWTQTMSFPFGGQNRLYLNDGSGVFTDGTYDTDRLRLPLRNHRNWGLAVADVDGRNGVDIIYANGGDLDGLPEYNALYLNDGNGYFTLDTDCFMDYAELTGGVVVSDTNGDSLPDVIFANDASYRSRYYRNLGTDESGWRGFSEITPACFTPATYCSAVLGDVNGDNQIDVVMAGSPSRLFLGDGFANFTGPTRIFPGGAQGVSMGDVDGDDDLDLIFPMGWANVLYLNHGDGTYDQHTASTNLLSKYSGDKTTAGLLDVDDDNLLDVVLGYNDAGAPERLFLNLGTNESGWMGFTDRTDEIPTIDKTPTYGIAYGDVDGTGGVDLVIANIVWLPFQCHTQLFVNKGFADSQWAGFSDVTYSNLPLLNDQCMDATVGDVDGDGDLDLITAKEFFPGGRVLINMGSYQPSPSPSPTQPPCNGDWMWMTDVTGVGATADWALITDNYNALDLNIPTVIDISGEVSFDTNVCHGYYFTNQPFAPTWSDGTEYHTRIKLYIYNSDEDGSYLTIPEGWWIDLHHDGTSERWWFAQTTLATDSGFFVYPSTNGNLYTDEYLCDLFKAAVTPSPSAATPTPTPYCDNNPLFVHLIFDAMLQTPRADSPSFCWYSPWSDENGTLWDNSNACDWGGGSEIGYYDMYFFIYSCNQQASEAGDLLKMWYQDTAGGEIKTCWIGLPSKEDWAAHSDGQCSNLYVDTQGNTYWDSWCCETAHRFTGHTPPYSTPTPSPSPSSSSSPSPSATSTPSPTPSPWHLVVDADDYDGDGLTDYALWYPVTAYWQIYDVTSFNYGTDSDIPACGDYNADGTADVAVFRGSSGTWYLRSPDGSTIWNSAYGISGDIPVPADYDGDFRSDTAVWRPSNGKWSIKGQTQFYYGLNGDIPVPGDYDGDGTADASLYRYGVGYAVWYVRNISTVYYGQPGDIPVPGDYDGDATTEFSVLRPSSGTWYIRNITSFSFGQIGDIPFPFGYSGDGTHASALYRPSEGKWYIYNQTWLQFGVQTDIPIVGQPY